MNFWRILNYLHEKDDMEFTKDWPTEPNNQKGGFIFNQEHRLVYVNIIQVVSFRYHYK